MSKHWNFGTPKRDAPRIAYRDVRITRAGRTWTATWHTDGEKLYVSSAYGSRTEPVGRSKNLANRATELLSEIIDG